MDSLAFGTPFSNMDINVMMKMNSIDRSVQMHLSRVYTLLALTVFSAAVGVYTFMSTGYGMNGLFGMLGIMGIIFYLSSTRTSILNMNRVLGLLFFGFLKGLTLGGLCSVIIQVDPAILVISFLSTTCVFLCFTGAALLAQRRSYLYLGGLCSSAISFFLLLSFLQFFMSYPSELIFNIHLYGGLLVFTAYVIFDTQIILEEAIAGGYYGKDAVWHALTLFIDFVAIFVRIAIILLKNSTTCKDERNKRKKR